MGKFNFKPNEIKVDFGSYRHYWRGIKKIGKTTLYRDVVLAEYGDLKHGLLISMGNETGYKALDGIYAVEAQTWGKFVEYVDDLVENPKDNEFKVVAFDTVDELIALATLETLKKHQEFYNKKAKTLNEAMGGYGSGHEFAKKLINDQIKRLEGRGYGLVFIGHTKLKDIKEKGEAEGYQQLTSSLDPRFDGIFADKADIIATMYVEKIVKNGQLKDKQRYIFFRDDGLVTWPLMPVMA